MMTSVVRIVLGVALLIGTADVVWAKKPQPTRSLQSQEVALFDAAWSGDTSAVRSLLAAGVNVNARDPASKTALMAAAVNGYAETVKVLLAAGADVDAADEYGETALMNAAFNGYVNIVDLLVEKGVNVDAARNGDLRVTDALLAAGADVNARTLDGDTALMMGSAGGYIEIVRALLAMNADVNAKNRFGETAIDVAAEEGHLHVVRLLLKARRGGHACFGERGGQSVARRRRRGIGRRGAPERDHRKAESTVTTMGTFAER